MAPGRKKGSGKAAAAAASRQQWKIGDLVLAKMKGFPAWPATVSEPEKWGYSSDRKKVLVYFYGTKQIAFCNHADIEAFTEEKKKALLNKRHGKGADFVRAVDEIIDIYEKLKNKTQDEVCLDESFRTSLQFKSLTTHNHQAESLYTPTESSDVRNSEEILRASAEADLCNMNSVDKEPSETVFVPDQLRQSSLVSTNSRKEITDAPVWSCAIQRKVPSMRRARSSLSVEPCKCQNLISQSVDTAQDSDHLTTVTMQEELTIQNNPISVVPNNACCCDVDLHVSTKLVSCQRANDIEPEMVAVGPEATHLNDCIISEPSWKDEQSENGYLEKDDRVNGKLDHSMKAVILKKKRKPNRKRTANATECIKLDKELEIQNEQRENIGEPPLNSGKETIQRFQKADGDEHLPLVKRARVRMRKLHLEETHVDEIVSNTNEKEDVGLIDNTGMHAVSFCVFDGGPADNTSFEFRNSSCHLQTEDFTPRSDPISCKADKYQINDSTLDVEAALPPSKRLHRALKAMSANATKPLNDYAQASKSMELESSGCMDPPGTNSSELLTDRNIGSSIKAHNLPFSNSIICNKALSLPSSLTSQIPKVSVITSSEVKHDEMLKGKLSSPYCEDCSGSIFTMVDSEIQARALQTVSLFSTDSKANAVSSEFMPDKSSSPIIVEKVNKILEPASQVDKIEGVEPPVQKLGCFSNSKESNGFFPVKDAGVVPPAENVAFTSSITSRATSSCRSDGNSGARDMQEVSKEAKVKINHKDMAFSTDMTPMKVLIATAQAKRLLSRSTSFSETDGKVVSYAAISPSVNPWDDYSERGSSPNHMIYNRPSSDNRADLLHNRSRSPQGSVREQGLNKLRGFDEANAARKSFEAILCTLSRTKESIGRATRLAIDCAKCGIAREVVEILLQHLERESNLYRRIDLFFLVDSITQCSHNQKGGMGDMYPSLVQSVLPRLLAAAAPSGNAALENRKQCLKVLRLWLERKTLPESVVRHHMKELDYLHENSFNTVFSKRLLRTERALNDPLREMEGMLVDEYGSNTNFQLPGLLNPPVLEDEEEGSACEEKSFEAVTPERNVEVSGEKETAETSVSGKRRHILEDVDGELEMEDVAPLCGVEVSSDNHASGVDTASINQYQFDQNRSLSFAPPLPEDMPPSPPPLPSSPPPTVHPSTGPLHASRISHTHSMQSQLAQCYNQCTRKHNSNLMTSESVPCCASGYGGNLKQMLPPLSHLSSCSSYGSLPVSNPAMHSSNTIQCQINAASPNVVYHVQPPHPVASNQFSYVQGESHKSAQSWGPTSSFTKGLHFVNDYQGGNFYGKVGSEVQIKHEMSERGQFSPAVHPGPPLPSMIDAPPMAFSYGPSSEPSSIPCRGWSLPPRASGYHSTYSRPSLDPLFRVAGAPGYWRPR